MLLPNPDQAIADEAKVRDYLLSDTHPVGRFKAAFFRALGYSSDDWEELRRELLWMAQTQEARLGPETEYGQKYELRAMLQGPAGRSAEVICVWIVRREESAPRFVTAYPR